MYYLHVMSMTEQLFDEICAKLAQGMSLRSVLREENMPDMVTVLKYLREHEEAVKQYARAKQDGADAWADDLVDISEKVQRGELDPNAARVAADIKKWAASKLKPKVYGDKIDMTTNGKDLPSPIYAGLSTSKPKEDPSKT